MSGPISRKPSDPERFRGDRPVAAREGRDLPIGGYDPPHLDVPTLQVDTTDGYKPTFEAIVSFVLAKNRG